MSDLTMSDLRRDKNKLDEAIEALTPKVEAAGDKAAGDMDNTVLFTIYQDLALQLRTLTEQRGALQAQLAAGSQGQGQTAQGNQGQGQAATADLGAFEERLQAMEAKQAEDKQAMEATMRRLLLQQSNTVISLEHIGKEWMSKGVKINGIDMPFWERTIQREQLIAECIDAVLKLYPRKVSLGRLWKKEVAEVDVKRELPGMSLADASWPDCRKNWKEDTGGQHPDQQQLLVGMIREVQRVTKNNDVYLLETNNASRRLQHPEHRPDLTSLAEMTPHPTWSQVVSFWEWKKDKSDQAALFGQLIQRCSALLYEQRAWGRKVVFAVGITMNTLLVMQAEPDSSCQESLSIRHTEWQPFSFSAESPGFQLLVQVLAAKRGLLGYRPATFPSIESFKTLGVQVHFNGILKLRTRQEDSYVFYMSAQRGSDSKPYDAVVKLNRSNTELMCLQELAGVDNVVPLSGHIRCEYLGDSWDALLLGVWAQRLSCQDSLATFAQVAYDISSALNAAYARGVLHRDVTPSNFGHVGGKGYLMDWSSGKIFDEGQDMGKVHSSSGAPMAITGTMLHCPFPILSGRQHTMSSQLDGLFISLLNISCDGKVYGHKQPSGPGEEMVEQWRRTRIDQFSLGLSDKPNVAPCLLPFITDLFHLFWKQQQLNQWLYVVEEVTPEQFQEVCTKYTV